MDYLKFGKEKLAPLASFNQTQVLTTYGHIPGCPGSGSLSRKPLNPACVMPYEQPHLFQSAAQGTPAQTRQ